VLDKYPSDVLSLSIYSLAKAQDGTNVLTKPYLLEHLRAFKAATGLKVVAQVSWGGPTRHVAAAGSYRPVLVLDGPTDILEFGAQGRTWNFTQICETTGSNSSECKVSRGAGARGVTCVGS
jgi:hypothetical protein